MTRIEMYDYIKKYSLEGQCSRCYTNCTNKELEKVIALHKQYGSKKPSKVIASGTVILDNSNPYVAAIVAELTILKCAGKLDEILALV